MANKLFMESVLTTEKITADEITEYVNTVLNTALNMKFRSADAIKHLAVLKNIGINVCYVNCGTRLDRVVLGSAYCLITDDEYGKLELPENYINMAATTDLVKEITNTLIHEIAHFIAGSAHGHDTVWVSIAERLGKEMNKNNMYFGSPYFTSRSINGISMGDTVYSHIDAYGDIEFGNCGWSEYRYNQICEQNNYTVIYYNTARTAAEYVKIYNEAVAEAVIAKIEIFGY